MDIVFKLDFNFGMVKKLFFVKLLIRTSVYTMRGRLDEQHIHQNS